MRIARFADLRPLATQVDPLIPQDALDLIYSRRLLPVLGLGESESALSSGAPIRGGGGITITYAVCPPGQGPDLHRHKRTFETFTVLDGEFEFRWGETGEHRVRLGRLDVISLPPGHARAFRNVGDVEGVLQVIISGGEHDANDVVIPSAVAEEVRRRSPRLYEQMAKNGITLERVASE